MASVAPGRLCVGPTDAAIRVRRIATAAVIIALLLAVLWLPWQAFALLMALVLLLAWNEYARLVRPLGVMPASVPGALMALGCALSFASSTPSAPLLWLLLAVLVATAASLREGYSDPARFVGALAATLCGIVWLGLVPGAHIGLRRLPDGETWLLFAYAAVAVGDSAALYGGTAFGRRKLAPFLSPNKTVEGTVSGIVGSAAAGYVVGMWLPGVGDLQAVGLGVLLGATGQVGDLMESALKRAAGVKDSSTLLPGHGGVLDRVDSHLPAGAALYLILTAGWVA